MKLRNTIFTLFICTYTLGQAKTLYNVTSPNGDTSFWFKHQTALANKLSLPPVATSSYAEHIRIWSSAQIIDMWQNEDGKSFGRLNSWTHEYVSGNEEPTNRSFIRVDPLRSDTVALLRQLLKSSNVLELPTDDSIPGWQQGLDGITYLIEHSTTTSYSFKSYWTPKAQGSLREALQVQAFIDSAFKLANATAAFEEFTKQIPYESYYNGGPSAAVKALSAKERKKYRKERANYRKRRRTTEDEY